MASGSVFGISIRVTFLKNCIDDQSSTVKVSLIECGIVTRSQGEEEPGERDKQKVTCFLFWILCSWHLCGAGDPRNKLIFVTKKEEKSTPSLFLHGSRQFVTLPVLNKTAGEHLPHQRKLILQDKLKNRQCRDLWGGNTYRNVLAWTVGGKAFSLP